MRAQTSFLTRLPSPQATGEENAWLSYFTTQRVYASLSLPAPKTNTITSSAGKQGSHICGKKNLSWFRVTGLRSEPTVTRSVFVPFLTHFKSPFVLFCFFLWAALVPYWPLVTSRGHQGVWGWPSAASGIHSQWLAHSGLHTEREREKKRKTKRLKYTMLSFWVLGE